jgi:glycosyltransferase involved in cell wall biosynthesis
LKVIFDGSYLHNLGGIGRDSRTLLDAVKSSFGESQISIIYPVGIRGKLLETPPKKITLRLAQLYCWVRKKTIEIQIPAHSIFIQSHISLYTPKDFSGKHVLRLHDIFPISNPEWFRLFSRKVFELGFNSISDSTTLFYDSESTKFSVAKYSNRNQNNDKVLLCPVLLSSEEPCNNCRACRFVSDANAHFLAIGTIEPRKNYDFLLEAWDEFSSENTDIKQNLVIIGKSGWKNRKLISRLHTTRKTIWIDSACDFGIKKILQDSIALISSSKDEGFGLTPGEALLFGVPIILSDILIYREIYPQADVFFSLAATDQLKDAFKIFSDKLIRNAPENLFENRFNKITDALLLLAKQV